VSGICCSVQSAALRSMIQPTDMLRSRYGMGTTLAEKDNPTFGIAWSVRRLINKPPLDLLDDVSEWQMLSDLTGRGSSPLCTRSLNLPV
jgi:hypothetical protein